MSVNEEKLITDHSKVLEYLSQKKNIRLVDTDGDPVDEYDLEFRVKGFSYSPKGGIAIRKHHRIKIQLPFGYPHFPPTVKVLSPIFHPDIDDQIVLIADYWQENPSLVDLLDYLVDMITGKVFSRDNAFNVKAVEYYLENQNKLPLQTFDEPAVEEKEEIVVDRSINLGFLIPLFKLLIVAIVTCTTAFAGFYFFEKSKLDTLFSTFEQANIALQDRDYTKAKENGDEILVQLDNLRLKTKNQKAFRKRVTTFLSSEALTEGLRGKVKYGNSYLDIEIVHKLEFITQLNEKADSHARKNNINEAVEQYTKTLNYAIENNLEEYANDTKIALANLKTQVLIQNSEKAHTSRNWEWAIKQHATLVDYLRQEKAYIRDPQPKLLRAEHLLLFDQVALYSQLASEAETKGDLLTSSENYKKLIDTIGKTENKSSKTLKDTLVEAMQKYSSVTEKLNIKTRRQWLLANYREIFPIHYPSVIPASLRSPKAFFVQYIGNTMIFDLSCLDKSGGSVVKLRLLYQYDPLTKKWDIFTGALEN